MGGAVPFAKDLLFDSGDREIERQTVAMSQLAQGFA